MSRTLKLLLAVAVAVVMVGGVYLVGSFAGASENDPPPREPVVLPSDTTSPSTGAPSTTSPSPSESVPVISPSPVDDDDDDDDDDDRDDDD